MRFDRRLFCLCLGLVALLLAGCGGAPQALAVHLISPRTSTVIWPSFPYMLAAQATGPGSGTGSQPVHITFLANGQTIGAADATMGAEAVIKWTPPVGSYTIQAQAQVSGGQAASSAIVQLCILNIDTSHGFPLWGYGYQGPCALPPASTSSAPVTLHASAEPAGLSYSYHCSSTVGPAVISFQARVSDPGNRVAFVGVRYTGLKYILKGPAVFDGAIQGTLYDSLILNQTSVAADGTKVFTGSTEDLGAFSADVLAGGSASIEWLARALSSNGAGANQVIVQDGPYDVPIGPCTPPPAPSTPTP